MTFYIDLDLLRVVATPGYSSPVDAVRVRRGDTVPFVVQFSQGGVAVDPGAAAVGVLAAGAVGYAIGQNNEPRYYRGGYYGGGYYGGGHPHYRCY